MRLEDIRKRYVKPEIILEIELETQAGSGPLGHPGPLDVPEE